MLCCETATWSTAGFGNRISARRVKRGLRLGRACPGGRRTRAILFSSLELESEIGALERFFAAPVAGLTASLYDGNSLRAALPEIFVDKFLIKLYVTGETPRAQRAITNLRRICDGELEGKYEMVVIDVLERPQLAEDERILATPMVVKELPLPIRRIIGDLSNSKKVLLGLDLAKPNPMDRGETERMDELFKGT